MSNEVYANTRAVSCKGGAGMVNAAFPDVCLSPPSPPAGPIPIPYPVFSVSGDTTSGSKTVKIDGKEVMLRDESYFKQCTGDEPATKSLGMGVITHTIQGKVYFVSWSMDVQIEGKNVVRHLDMTTSNHASPMATAAVPMVEAENQQVPTQCQQAESEAVRTWDEQPDHIKSGNFAVAGAKFEPSSPAPDLSTEYRSSSRISSNMTLEGKKYNDYASGKGLREPSDVTNCDGSSHTYTTNTHHPNESHAEAKIMEDLFAEGRPSGTLYISILWKHEVNGKSQIDASPCEECQKLFKKATEGCDDFKIVIC